MAWVVHALVDVALGIGLLVAGFHGRGDGYLLLDAAGAYLLVVSVVTDGPRTPVKLLPRIGHRFLDAAVALALVASPFGFWRAHGHIDIFTTAMAEAVGVILLRNAWATSHRPTARLAGGLFAPGAPGGVGAPPTGGTWFPGPVIEARAVEKDAPPREGGGEVPGTATARAAAGAPGAGRPGGAEGVPESGSSSQSYSLGRLAGRLSADAAEKAPEVARKAGLIAGRVKRAGREAMRARTPKR